MRSWGGMSATSGPVGVSPLSLARAHPPPIINGMDVSTIDPLAVVIDGFEIPEDLDAPYPTPYGDNPPLEWLTTPHHDVIAGASALITADGRFCAYSHEWDRCHNGYTGAGECWTPPRSPTQGRYFHQGSVVTAEGVQLPAGVIPLGPGHAPADVDIYQAMAWYDKPTFVTVRARAVEVEDGCVMCGAIVPGTTYRQVAQMRASALSGDWRWVPELGAMEFLGPCFVARPGLPIGLEEALVAASLWDITRQLDVTTAAGSDQVLAVQSRITSWSPRPITVSNIPAPVIAAALQPQPTGASPMSTESTTSSCSCQPSPAANTSVTEEEGGRVITVDPEPAALEVTVASAAEAVGGWVRGPRVRRAAAGTGLTYQELADRVRGAIQTEFSQGEGRWAYLVDWDDTFAIFELEADDLLEGHIQKVFRIDISFAGDGTVTMDRSSLTEVTEVYVPVTGMDSTSPAERPAVAAHASDTAAIGSLSEQLDVMMATLEGLASDVAQLQAAQLSPAEIAEELPAAPPVS